MDCLNKKMLIQLSKELFNDGDFDHPVFEVNSVHTYNDGDVIIVGYIYLIDYEEDYYDILLSTNRNENLGYVTEITVMNAEGFVSKKFYYKHSNEVLYNDKQFYNLTTRLEFME